MELIELKVSRGIIKADNSILLCKGITRDNFFLPGGKIERYEGAHSALSREIKEETGLEIKFDKLLGVIENQYFDNERNYFETNYIFFVEIEPMAIQSLEPEISFEWVSDLSKCNILPLSIKDLLISLNSFNKKLIYKTNF